jgi:hypothetical protein
VEPAAVILDEAGKLATQVLASLNQRGDPARGLWYDDGSVSREGRRKSLSWVVGRVSLRPYRLSDEFR